MILLDYQQNMSEYDIVNKSWNEIAFACKQKNKKILRKCLEGCDDPKCMRNSGNAECLQNCHDPVKIRFIAKLFEKCVIYDTDCQCIESLLPYIAARYEFSMDRIIDEFGLMTSSIRTNRKLFEYLVRTTNNINGHIKVGYARKPILHLACENSDDVAVGILLKYGASVNEKSNGVNALYYAIESYGRPHMKAAPNGSWRLCHSTGANKISKRIIRMLLLAGCDRRTIIKTPIMVGFDDVIIGKIEDPDLSRVICEAVKSFAENCY